MGDRHSGLQVIDISIPESPSIVSSVDTPSEAHGVAAAGDYAYVADYYSGLQVILIPTLVPGEAYEYYVETYKGTLTASSGADHGSMYVPEPPETEVTELTLRLIASDRDTWDFFGRAVAISGDRAIIGAYYDDDNGSNSGSAYIFERGAGGTWTETEKLLAGDGTAGDHFGGAVAISGDWAIVGAPRAAGDSGAAYIFERGAGGTWTETEKLLADDGVPDDSFGGAVAMSGDQAIVGATGDDDKGDASGSAYVFERDAGGTWTQTQKLLASDGAEDDAFGGALAISGDRAVIGATGDDDKGDWSGSAYIFERNPDSTWGQTGPEPGKRYETAKILASDGAADDYFGWSAVAIDGDRAVVGAPGDDDKGYASGSAYIFDRDAGGTWGQTGPEPGKRYETAKILADDGAEYDRFGGAVAIGGDRAIVGASGHDGSRGLAYVFERDAGGDWTETEMLVAGDAGDVCFGTSLAMSRDRAIFGASCEGVLGSAYLLDLAGSAYAVSATDGTLKSRVRITWEDRSTNERGFRIYRDSDPIGSVEPNVEVYEDFDAEPGRTYQYAVATLKSDLSEELPEVLDYGWRQANGNITGRISTRGGAAAEGISVAIEPLPTKALLFDGAGGHVLIPDSAGTFGFTKEESYTIEIWVKYTGDGGSGAGDGTMIAKASPESGVERYPFSLGNMRKTGEPGQIYFNMSDGADTVGIVSDSTTFNDNTWHHVACAHDATQDSITLYVDGVLQGGTTYTSLGNIANTEPLSLGVGAVTGSWFGGQLDEVRIWNVARSAADIQTGMYTQLVGNEDGLVAYWPLDEGSPDEVRQGGNAAITDLTSGAHYGALEGGVYWTESSAPLDIYPETDAEGTYVLRGIRYGTLAEFKVRPFDGERQFEPAYQVVTLTTEDPVENQVNFSDISSFTVSGVVRYDSTSCPATDVAILVADQPAGVTDKNGKFAVSVDYVGKDNPYTIKPDLTGHTFEPESLTVVVEHDTLLVDPTGVTFTDMTKRTLSGRVGGGCGCAIGDVIITVQSENGCLVLADTVPAGDSTYSLSLPPQTYLAAARVVEATIPSGLDRADVVGFYQNLGARVVRMDTTDLVMDFVYRAPIQVVITGMESYVTCSSLTFEGRTLPDSLPVIPQGDKLILSIEVNEDYGAGATCPLDGGTVTIYDEISDREDEPMVLQVRNGVAGVVIDSTGEFIPSYRTIATTPSLIVGRLDAEGNDRTFQKSVRAVLTVEGRSPITATEWALVTGHVAPEGADFVTFTTEPMPFYILRDPPGDDSYAFLDKGYAFNTTVDFDIGSATVMAEGEESKIDNTKWGISFSISPGWSWKSGFSLGLSFDFAYMWEDRYHKATWTQATEWAKSTVVSTKIDEHFATSSGDLWVGEPGDIFIGAGLNYIFAKVGVIEVEGCEVIPSEAMGVEPEGFATTFAYTEQHIEDVLIPELESMIDHYSEQGYLDSVCLFEDLMGTWEYMLAANDSLKWGASSKENRSFSAGAEYAYSFSSDTTRAFRETVTLYKDSETDDGWYLNILGVRQVEKLTVTIDRSHNVQAMTDTSGTHSMTVGYVLSDDDIGT